MYFTVFVSTFTLMGMYTRVCVCVELNFILIILMYLGVSLVYIFVIGYVAVRKFRQFHGVNV